MGVFLWVWIPDHVREAMDRQLADGPLRDDEEMVNAALSEYLGFPTDDDTVCGDNCTLRDDCEGCSACEPLPPVEKPEGPA